MYQIISYPNDCVNACTRKLRYSQSIKFLRSGNISQYIKYRRAGKLLKNSRRVLFFSSKQLVVGGFHAINKTVQ
jgi:hypothetical protein